MNYAPYNGCCGAGILYDFPHGKRLNAADKREILVGFQLARETGRSMFQAILITTAQAGAVAYLRELGFKTAKKFTGNYGNPLVLMTFVVPKNKKK